MIQAVVNHILKDRIHQFSIIHDLQIGVFVYDDDNPPVQAIKKGKKILKALKGNMRRQHACSDKLSG